MSVRDRVGSNFAETAKYFLVATYFLEFQKFEFRAGQYIFFGNQWKCLINGIYSIIIEHMSVSEEEQDNLNLEELRHDFDREFAEFIQILTEEEKKINNILEKMLP